MSLAPCRFSAGRVESQGIHLLISQSGNVYQAWILTFIMRMTSLCLQLLQHRFVDWTKLSTPSLVLGTLTDLPRSKSLWQTPKYFIRDHDRTFGPCFAQVAYTRGIKVGGY